MSLFGGNGGGDWDLRAVVRGCNMSMDDIPHTCFSPLMSYHYLHEEEDQEVMMKTNIMDVVAHDDHDLIFGNLVFPEYLFGDISSSSPSTIAAGAVTATNTNNSSDLFNPFYMNNISFSFSPQSTSSDNNLLSDDQNPQPDHVVPAAVAADDQCSKPVGAKYRRRKNQQHKRVVVEVTADGLCSDMWAWRKYGQKPIKGSPYPRSYYRCSSSRGCPARKQVERSTHHDHDHDHSDLINTNNSNTTFIITYTAEHNHSKPTRRNSLAGTTRQRFSTSNVSSSFKPTTAASHEQDMMIKKKMRKNNNNDRPSLRPALQKKTEIEAAGDHGQVKEITIINHDHMMMMNDFDFDQDQLNAAASASGDLQFHPNEVAHTGTNFW